MENEQLVMKTYIFIFYLLSLIFHLLSFIFYLLSIQYPASSPAGRIPSWGGISRPEGLPCNGAHSRRMTVFCLSAADSQL
jgi:hypothetical protein